MNKNKLDKLEIRKINLADPKAKYIKRPYDYVDEDTNAIFINGKEFISILRDIELNFLDHELEVKNKDVDFAGYYAYENSNFKFVSFYNPKKKRLLYSNFLCCGGCGIQGCNSVEFKICWDNKFVYWKSFRNIQSREWTYKLKFIFNKDEYIKTIKKLEDVGK